MDWLQFNQFWQVSRHWQSENSRRIIYQMLRNILLYKLFSLCAQSMKHTHTVLLCTVQVHTWVVGQSLMSDVKLNTTNLVGKIWGIKFFPLINMLEVTIVYHGALSLYPFSDLYILFPFSYSPYNTHFQGLGWTNAPSCANCTALVFHTAGFIN